MTYVQQAVQRVILTLTSAGKGPYSHSSIYRELDGQSYNDRSTRPKKSLYIHI